MNESSINDPMTGTCLMPRPSACRFPSVPFPSPLVYRQEPTTLVEELTPVPEPWDCVLALAHLPHLLFLDSAGRDEQLGHYSFVMADPFAWLSSRRGDIDWKAANGSWSAHGDPFAVLERCLGNWHLDHIPGLPPFQGGAAGLFGYDLCHHIEQLPRPRYDEFALPDLAVGFYDWVLAFDHHQHRVWLVSTGIPETGKARQQRARHRIQAVRHALQCCRRPKGKRKYPLLSRTDLAPTYPLPGHPQVYSNFDPRGYRLAIQRAIEYVHAGDCFQVNLAQRLLHPARLSPLDLYAQLRERNPAPFAGFFDMGQHDLVSASPERFLRVQQGQVETRPIKGTRPRGANLEEDNLNAQSLLGSEKDRAENVMIVDLMRNDLGRVCSYGTIRVEALCRLESYRTVHHLVSEVRGQLHPQAHLVDLLRATFPGGSVTGAPKIRAMEIIAELEPTTRGPYCGSLGYLGFDGSLDTNILIRTITVSGGWLQFPVGGGIVADSTPEAEYAETLHKAEGILRALR